MNGLLEGVRRVHFVGVGGIGMSALARYLLIQGFAVSGSDQNPGEQGEMLSSLGADVQQGHRASNLGAADLVVVTAAVRPGNPEVQAALDRGIPVVQRAALLGEIARMGRAVAVAGTHGKTTTSGLIGHMLVDAGLDPTILIGGIVQSLGSNARVGQSDVIVAEADEYAASFLHIRPDIGIILNAEPEHLDFYGTAERVAEAFHTFAAGVTGTLIACADDAGAMAAARGARVPVMTYGLDAGDLRAQDIRVGTEAMTFRVDGADFSTQLAGRHNVRNCLAAIATGRVLGLSGDAIGRGMATFTGTARRAERVGVAGGVEVVDDYGHHPTEVRTTLQALKERYRRPVRVIFQPHTYTRTRDFLDQFGVAFGAADAVYVLDIYAAREQDTLGMSGADVVRAASPHHPHVRYTPTAREALEAIVADSRPGDIVVTMGAGDVGTLAPQILEALHPS